MNAALTEVAEKHPHLKAVVLLSDGDWNAGQPPAQAATRLRMRGVPVFTVPLGSETRLPDVELTSFEVPAFAIAGKPLRIPFSIESSLPREETAVVEMKSSTGEVLTKSVVIPAMSRLQDVLLWKPEQPGELKLTLTVPKTGGELFLENKHHGSAALHPQRAAPGAGDRILPALGSTATSATRSSAIRASR